MDPTNLLYLEGRSDNSTHLKDGGIALAMVVVKRGIVHLPTAFPVLSDKDFGEAFVKIVTMTNAMGMRHISYLQVAE